MARIRNPKISKHVYDTEEEARYAFDSFKDVLDENGEIIERCYHKPMGLKAEIVKTTYIKETIEVLNEDTGENESWEIDTDEVLQEEYPTGRWQLDVRWFFEESEEGVYEVPTEFKDSNIDLEHEGNHGLSGYSYLKNKV